MHKQFEFWYEFASTYSYLAALRIEKLSIKNDILISWKPFLLGPIFKEQGWNTSPFKIYESKGNYMWRDIERLSIKYQIPYKKPDIFPQHTVLASRIAILDESGKWIAEFSKKVFQANFSENKDISDISVLSDIISSIGLDSEKTIEDAQSDENKLKLRKQVNRAFELGIFGAPSFIVENELFWGQDRLEDAIDHYKNVNFG